jgi:hypothetical protein
MQVTRKRFFGAALVSAILAATVMAGHNEVSHFTTPGAAVAGSPIATSVTVNQAPMSVTFTSSPAGLVNYTTTLSSTSASVSIPTSGSAGPGSYTITATPTAGGTSKSSFVAVETP